MLELLKVRFMQFILGYVFILSGTVCYSLMTILYPLRWIGFVNWHRNFVRLLSYLHWSCKYCLFKLFKHIAFACYYLFPGSFIHGLLRNIASLGYSLVPYAQYLLSACCFFLKQHKMLKIDLCSPTRT